MTRRERLVVVLLRTLNPYLRKKILGSKNISRKTQNDSAGVHDWIRTQYLSSTSFESKTCLPLVGPTDLPEE